MKHVLLLGDSIRLGYDEYAEKELKDIAQVYYSEDNGRCTQYTLITLPDIINLTKHPEKIDLIHWNNGHWDAAHFGTNAPSLNTQEQYADMLKRIAGELKIHFPNAKLVFATTTPMNPNGSQSINERTTKEIIDYNETAKQVMKKLGIPVNDLFALMENKGSDYYKDYCHYTEEGCRILGKQVAQIIKRELRL